MKRLLLIFCMLFAILFLRGQQKECIFTHYSSKEGLSQNTIMYMLQDHNGFLWFATWDGINRFDGYSFITYKARPDNDISLTNNRINWMGEDRWGYLWLLSYDYHAYRFNPSKEVFEQVPAKGEWADAKVETVTILDNGSVWLTCKDGGVLRILSDRDGGGDCQVDAFTSKSEPFQVQMVHDVVLDSQGEVWLLTNSGLGLFKQAQGFPLSYFAGNGGTETSQPFYASCEHDHQLYFSSNRGHIWNYDEKKGNFRLISLPTEANIVDVDMISDHELLACTESDGLYLYDILSAKITALDIEQYDKLKQVHIQSAYVDRFGIAWFQVNEPQTICYFNHRIGKLKIVVMKEEMGEAIASNPSFHIHEDKFNNLWIHPYAGGFSRYDRENDKLVPFYNEPGTSDWKFSSKIHSAMSDEQGNLWLCTHSKGLEKVSFVDRQFLVNYVEDCKYESLKNNVRTFFQDNEGNLWICMKNGLISIYDKNHVYRGYLTEQGQIAQHGMPVKGVAYAILQDKKGVIWIGTRGEGLLRVEKLKVGYQISRFKNEVDDIYSLSDNSIFCFYEDAKGILWIATFGGGLNYVLKDGGEYKFINYRNNLKNYPIATCGMIRHMAADNQGNIWLGTSHGAVCFKNQFKMPEDIVFDVYTHIPGDSKSLSNNEVHWVLSTRKNDLYFLTFGGGLCKLAGYDAEGKAQFISYTMKNGLASDVLLSAQEDSKGNLWISTENGVSKFVPSTGYSKNFSDNELGIAEAQFNEAASFYDSDGYIYFGTTHGYISFHPDSIRISSFIPKIIFSKLSVLNNETSPAMEGTILEQSINDSRELVLPHDKNMLTITFAALDMIHTDNIRYSYKLENFDADWIYSGGQHAATYTNLPTGHYVFHVKSTNGDGVWCDNARTLAITIQPAFWETIWAYLIYSLVVIAVVYIAVYILFVIFRLKHEVSVEQKIADVKLRFFTDISHELRTPLTLIAGPLEYVLNDTHLSVEVRKQLQLMQRNTDRMLRLVNQILDFRKIQNHKMKLFVQQIEMVSFLQRIMENFYVLAEEHRLDFVFYTESEKLYLWADADKLEKIVFNLLSNAFKYTPDGKMVKVSLHEDGKSVFIEVQDQGIGIPENKRSSLFVRFESHLNQKYFSQYSSGIGLSLVKELVDLHRGGIEVDSTPGRGTCFVVELLKGKEHFDGATEFVLEDIAEVIPGHLVEEHEIVSIETNGEKNNQVMLLVEDNQELREFLHHLFIEDYIVYMAANGADGLNKALDIVPDVIISDVMMPKMDGVEMVKMLRKDVSTSHIPIVLLTAKTDIESRLQGLEIGADDYITKPFSASYLRARITNLLQRRKDMQDFFTSNLLEVKQEETEAAEGLLHMTEQDCRFLEKLKGLIEERMDNSELLIGDLVKEMAVSRTIFFKKLKALTGLGPNEFLKEMRIRKAAQLLENRDYSITQVSDMVGINGSRYFAKCFKTKYGMTPSEYRGRIQ